MPDPEYEYYVGIDYGTSTCKLAYASPGLRKGDDPIVKNFAFARRGTEGSPRFPSGVVFQGEKEGGQSKVIVGFEAEDIMQDDRRSRTAEVVVSPKMDFGEGVVYPFAPMEYSDPADLCSLTLEAMLKEFERTLRIKRSQCRFLITVPSSFSSDQREDLRAAVNRLGIDSSEDMLVDEPNAAFLGLIGQPVFYTVLRRKRRGDVLLVDFGAGTCDMSILRIRDDPTNDPYGVEITNLAINDFAQLGGNDIDRDMALQIADYLKEKKKAVVLEKFDKLRKFVGKVTMTTKAAKEQLIRLGRVSGPGSPEDDVIGLRMLRGNDLNIRADKIPYSPDQLRQVIDRILGRDEGRRITFSSLLENVLGKARLEESGIGGVILAGGSAKLFQDEYFRSYLHERFPHLSGDQIISADDPDLLISRGAALECVCRYHERRSIIRPICPGDVGVRTAEGEFVTLLPAGTALPHPNQEDARHERHLYVPCPRPQSMRVPIAVRRFGEWKTVETWEVKLPDEYTSHEQLVFSCSMDTDKILKMRFSSRRNPSLSFNTVCTRWLHGKEPTFREVRIARMREQLRSQARKGVPLPPGSLISLVKEEYSAGMHDIVCRRCEYLLERRAQSFSREQQAILWNWLGLAHNRQWNYTAALHDYERAAELAPDESVYHYNVGVVCLWHKHDPCRAMASLKKAVERDRNSSTASYWYGRALEETGNIPESRLCYNAAWDILSRTFSPESEDGTRQLFRDVCDKLGRSYPDTLQAVLDLPDAVDPDNRQPGECDTGNIVCSSPSEN